MPKIVDHEERRRQLADAAARVAIRDGVEALTIRAVAREARCSTGALAHYYGSKDDLLIAVQRAAGEASMARIERALARNRGPALLEAVVLTVLPLDEARRGEWRLWLAYFARAAAVVELARVQGEHYGRWRDVLRTAFEGAFPEGRAPDPATLDRGTDATMALIQGLGVLGMFEPARLSAARQRQLVREHVARWTTGPAPGGTEG